MRHLSPFALLGVLALASAQSSADSTVGGTRRRLLNEKTALPHPKRALLHDAADQEGYYPATWHSRDGANYCEYIDTAGYCNATNSLRFEPMANDVNNVHQAWSVCTRAVGQTSADLVGWLKGDFFPTSDLADTTRVAAAEYVESWNAVYCYFDCPGFLREGEAYPSQIAIAAGSVPQNAPYLGPCIAPPAPPPMAPPMSPSELPGCTCHVYHNSAYKEMSRMCMKPWGDVNVCYPTRIATPGNPGQWQGSGEAAVYYDNFCHDFETMCQPLPDP